MERELLRYSAWMRRSSLQRALSASTRLAVFACGIAAAAPRVTLATEVAGRTPAALARHDPFGGVLRFLAPEPAPLVAHRPATGHPTAQFTPAHPSARVARFAPPGGGAAWRLAALAWRLDRYRAARRPHRAYADAVPRYPRIRVVQTRSAYPAYPPLPYANYLPYAYAPYPPYYPFVYYVLPDSYGYAGY